ncbi:MAG: helix-turn-helix domain-containing protein [Pseudonocardia sp.]|nr:helix-turn-helix domain-containing protein [Pseudonocardia sp.]
MVEAVGTALLRLVTPGTGAVVDDVTLAEPNAEVIAVPADLVLGAAVLDADDAIVLLQRAAGAGAGGVVLRSSPARDPRVVAAAEESGLALVELAPHASWAHLVWLLRGVLDRAAVPGSPLLGDAGVHGELFALADAAAAIVDAPVTIEDAQSRVLAYSARQERTDPARVSTIVGRRVPEEVVRHFRARGVFRKLAQSDEPIHVTDVPEGTLPRLVVPVRAGGEWLGSIWAVVEGPVATDRLEELTRAAAVLALHLLRLRAQAGMARRAATDRLRAVLRGALPLDRTRPDAEPWLPDGPWRVAALGTAVATAGVSEQLDLWESVTHRFGWRHPLLTDLDDSVYAVVTAQGGPRAAGSWVWLSELVGTARRRADTLTAVAGGLATERAELPRSRGEAAELHRLVTAGRFPGPVARIEEAWDAVVVARARDAVRARTSLLGGPLPALVAHDREHGTAYLTTLTAWLTQAGAPKAAAAALHIHPNTLRHRMQRIDEVAGPDLRSPRVRLALQLQLGALEAGSDQGS